MQRMTPNWTWTLSSQNYYIYTEYTRLRPQCFGPFCSTISRFRDTCTRWAKSEMHQMTLNWTWRLNSQKSSSSYGKRSSVRSSSDGPPHCPVSHAVAELFCWDVSIKSTLYIHCILIPEAQIFVRFALRLVVSEIKGRQKSDMHRVTRPKRNLNT